jgi:hypothetical protein
MLFMHFVILSESLIVKKKGAKQQLFMIKDGAILGKVAFCIQ